MPTPNYKNNIIAADFKIKNKDVYDFDMLYEVLHDWMVEHDFATRVDPEFNETLYLERVDAAGAKEHWIWWRQEKPSATSSIIYTLYVTYHAVRMEKTEIVKDGKKFKANKGECEIDVKANVVFDPEDRGPEPGEKAWKKGKILKLFFSWFWKRKMKSQLEWHKIELYREAYELSAAIKEYFKLNSFQPHKEHAFWPEEGIPVDR